MVSTRKIVIGALAAAAVIITFFWVFSGDKAKIKKQFNSLSELAFKDSDEHPFVAAANAHKIGNMFAENCQFELPVHSISKTYKQEEIPARVMAVRSAYSMISLKFHDMQISFPQKGSARVVFTAYVEGVLTMGEQIRDAGEFICHMEKFEKNWYVNRVEALSVLER
jgi:hypothetical protein